MLSKEQKELIKLVKLSKVDILDKTKAYSILINVGNMPKQTVVEYLKQVEKMFESIGMKDVVCIPIFSK